MSNSGNSSNTGKLPVATWDVALDGDFAEVVEDDNVFASVDWTKKKFIDQLLLRYAQHFTASTPPTSLADSQESAASSESGGFEYLVLFPYEQDTVNKLAKLPGILNLTPLFNDLYNYEYSAVDHLMPVLARMTALSKLLRQFRKMLAELYPSATGDFPRVLPFSKPAEVYEVWFCFYNKLPSGELSDGAIKFKVRLLSPPLSIYDVTL